MRDPKFYRPSGELTAYALACGYSDKRENLLGEEFQLWREGNTYHVRGFSKAGNRIFWDSYYRLSAAYKRFRCGETRAAPPSFPCGCIGEDCGKPGCTPL